MALTRFPSSAFFFNTVPVTGERILQLSSFHFAFSTLDSAVLTSARAASILSFRDPICISE